MLEPFVDAPEVAASDAGPTARRTFAARAIVLAVAVATLVTGTVAAAANGEADAPPAAAPPATSAPEAAPAPAPAPAEPPAPAAPAPPQRGPAYRVASADGGIFTHGWYGYAGSAAGATTSPIVGLAQSAGGDGYWLASADGGVFAFGTAPFHGSAPGMSVAPITDIAATPSHGGYWLTSADGGVFAFGDAGFHGAAIDLGLNKQVTALAATASGAGYWLASGDGGVFAFGDAPFFGALAEQPVNARIVDIVPTPSGQGYYLVAADGGVFTFGDAVYHGGAVGEPLPKPIVDMALHPDGSGYWLLARDGRVFSFGQAPYLGTPAASGTKGPFIAIAGGIGSHQPPPEPPAPPPPLPAEAAAPAPSAPVKAKAKPAKAPAAKGGKLLDNEFGWDISYPQCGGSYPEGPASYNIIGVNGGRAFRHNKCLAEQWRWARKQGPAGLYVNVHAPKKDWELEKGATSDRQPNCNGAPGCVAYNFALNGIRDSLAYARSQGVDAPFVWLDVEQLNYWAPEPELNAIVIRGAIDAVREAGKEPGIYSTPYQYKKITGDEQAQVPVWSAGAPGAEAVGTYCATRGFGGGPVVLVQLLPGKYDPNFGCPGAGAMSRYFAMP